MSVEINEAAIASRQVVPITWDQAILDGEVVKLYCVNPANGDVSESGLSANDGKGQVSYPLGYVGSTEITVLDNHGNSDFGVILVGEGDEVSQPEPPPEPTHPIVLPPDEGAPVDPDYGIEEGAHPVHPIVLPPEFDLGLLPTHPIVYPPEINPLS